MEHLNLETLARLVDHEAAPDEQRHLDRCPRCREELEGLREQTEALGVLPALRPPQGGWDALEERLRSEGLLSDSAPESGRAPARALVGRPGAERGAGDRSARWGRAGAMAATLVVGMGIGMGFSGPGDPADVPAAGERAVTDPAEVFAIDLDRAIDRMTVTEAEELVRLTEEWYLTSLMRYQERAREEGGAETPDPIGRFAAIEALVAAGRAAVREAPTDPFLNGLLLNMHAERELALRGLQARQAGDNWY